VKILQNALMGRLLADYESRYQLGGLKRPFLVLAEDVSKRPNQGNSRVGPPFLEIVQNAHHAGLLADATTIGQF